jgi:hypothetical protein
MVSTVPSNVNKLDQFLQKIIKQDVTLKEGEVKEANSNLQKVTSLKKGKVIMKNCRSKNRILKLILLQLFE